MSREEAINEFRENYRKLILSEERHCTQEWFDSHVLKIAERLYKQLLEAETEFVLAIPNNRQEGQEMSKQKAIELLEEKVAIGSAGADNQDYQIPFTIRDAFTVIGLLKSEPEPERPHIVCLCGSTRFMDAFFAAGWKFALEGKIVLSVGVCKHVDHHGAEALGQDVADRLDELHLRKIDLADSVFVLNVGGYIGESTSKEIEYAEQLGKPIEYLEDCGAYELGHKLVTKKKSEPEQGDIIDRLEAEKKELKEQLEGTLQLLADSNSITKRLQAELSLVRMELEAAEKEIERLRDTVERANEVFKSERHKRVVAEQALKGGDAKC
ncbi:MAG: hypothetical protein ACXABD_22750, partial [Candidatus Thorarchaeota archaeon]